MPELAPESSLLTESARYRLQGIRARVKHASFLAAGDPTFLGRTERDCEWLLELVDELLTPLPPRSEEPPAIDAAPSDPPKPPPESPGKVAGYEPEKWRSGA